jgi:hypothetical protein
VWDSFGFGNRFNYYNIILLINKPALRFGGMITRTHEGFSKEKTRFQSFFISTTTQLFSELHRFPAGASKPFLSLASMDLKGPVGFHS